MAASSKSRRKHKSKRTTEFDTTVWSVFFSIIGPLLVLVGALIFAWVLLR